MNIKRTILLLALCFSTSVFAYNTQKGTLKGYLPYATDNKEIFFFAIDTTASSGCNVTNRFAIDSTHQNFNSVISAVMAAYHSKTMIEVRYEKTCTNFGNAFDSSYVCIGDIPC